MKLFIPIDKVKKRSLQESNNIDMRKKSDYPLYLTYKDIYNYENLRESIIYWNTYSESIDDNINKVCELMNLINEKGNEFQIKESSKIVQENIIPTLSNPSSYKTNFNSLLKNDIVKQDINNIIYEQCECDRLLSNSNQINKRFNLTRYFTEQQQYNNLEETIHNYCNLIETYELDLKSKFCIAVENALYSLSKVQDYDPKIVLESCIDFYLLNYGQKDIPEFINNIKDAINKDAFISEEANQYLDYLQSVYDNLDGCEYEKEVLKYIQEDSDLAFLHELDEYKYISNSMIALKEDSFFQKARDYITKIKIAPTKTITMVKEAINKIMVTRRLQDIATNTRNALSVAFYCMITLGFFSMGLIPGVLGLISSLIMRKISDKSYLVRAIPEWNKHKLMVERKIKFAKGEERVKLEKYLESVNNNIKLLEQEWERIRDRTIEEYNAKKPTQDNSISLFNQSDINPIGQDINKLD